MHRCQVRSAKRRPARNICIPGPVHAAALRYVLSCKGITKGTTSCSDCLLALPSPRAFFGCRARLRPQLACRSGRCRATCRRPSCRPLRHQRRARHGDHENSRQRDGDDPRLTAGQPHRSQRVANDRRLREAGRCSGDIRKDGPANAHDDLPQSHAGWERINSRSPIRQRFKLALKACSFRSIAIKRPVSQPNCSARRWSRPTRAACSRVGTSRSFARGITSRQPSRQPGRPFRICRSNAPPTLRGARKRVTFATTPSMPTYLVVFCAGDFDYLSGSAGATQVNVYGTRGTGPELTYARDSLERLIPYFENYYGVKFPLPKLDLISIPQFFGGAMENWGGMTFTEDTVVYDPALQTPAQQRRIFDIIAHETSHQWNGDLVTMAWWDSLWLNEGFATWMETKSTAELNPSWNWWLGFDQATNGSLVADARRNTTKIQVPVHNETEANTIFDPEIAYQKAGAFLRMMEAYLGPETFRAGLHEYFVANAFSNSVPNDLWTALSACVASRRQGAGRFVDQSTRISRRSGSIDVLRRKAHAAAFRNTATRRSATTVRRFGPFRSTSKTVPVRRCRCSSINVPTRFQPAPATHRSIRQRRRSRLLSRRLRCARSSVAAAQLQVAERCRPHVAARRCVAIRG